MKKYMLGVLVLCILSASALAYPPMQTTYSGVMSTDSGVVNGRKNVTVRLLYGANNTPTGFSEVHNNLLFQQGGRFSVVIGSVGTLTVAHLQHDDVKVGITLDGENEVVLALDSSLYSVMASHAKTADTALGGVPAGTVIAFAGVTAPTGYLNCDGSAVSRTTYSSLFTAISTIYGAGDSSTTFNLPDYRGRFLRGHDNSAGTDPDASSRTDRGDGQVGDKVGTKQDEGLNKAHLPAYASWESDHSGGYHFTNYNRAYSNAPGQVFTDFSDFSKPPGNETRPKNINVMYIIKH